MLSCERLSSPLGALILVCEDGCLCALDYEDEAPRMRRLLRHRFGDREPAEGRGPAESRDRLTAYFAGDLAALSAIPVSPGGTVFQARVWMALRSIPPGTTKSYGALAAALGRLGAARAVGHANAQNPISIIIPCHRLIGGGGALTGYAGGLGRKRWLLSHEGALPIRRPHPKIAA